MKFFFFFERWPRIKGGKKKDFVPERIILPPPPWDIGGLADYIRLHKAIPFSNADCSAVVSMQNAPSSYMVAILCCCTRLSLWDLKSGDLHTFVNVLNVVTRFINGIKY